MWSPGRQIVLFIVGLYCACVYGMKIDWAHFRPHIRSSILLSKRTDENPCESEEPFLCKTSKMCISIQSVCDGYEDCSDGFDEDMHLCNAAKRPAVEDMIHFFADVPWPTEHLFDGADPELIAHGLAVSADLSELSRIVGISAASQKKLLKAFQSAVDNDERPLLKMGMPSMIWNELRTYLLEVVDNNFRV